MPTFLQTVKVAKSIALLSAAWTLLCAGLIVGRQAISWISTGVWDKYPLASVIKMLKAEPPAIYVTASSEEGLKPAPTIIHAIADWLLDIPVVFPLLLAAALLAVFHGWLVAVENDMARK